MVERSLLGEHGVEVTVTQFQDEVPARRWSCRRRRTNRLGGQDRQAAARAHLRFVVIPVPAEAPARAASQLHAAGSYAHTKAELHVSIIRVEAVCDPAAGATARAPTATAATTRRADTDA